MAVVSFLLEREASFMNKKISVYSSLFNVKNSSYDILEIIENWKKYSDEIVIATFAQEIQDTQEYLFNKLGNLDKMNVNLVSDEGIKKDDPLFDGKLKNKSLRECHNEWVIQMDMDERIGGDKEMWIENFIILEQINSPHTFFIPVIDLYKDYLHYKSINGKWYQHLKKGIFRGVVNFARLPNGKIDTNKSDSTEAVLESGDLAPYLRDLRFVDQADITFPHIIHLGYLDLNKRVENNKFWQPIWSARKGENVDVPTDLDSLNQLPYYKHNFQEKWWI